MALVRSIRILLTMKSRVNRDNSYSLKNESLIQEAVKNVR